MSKIIPLSLKEANSYIESNHRHHKKVQGHKFSIGLIVKNELVGVCVVGRPVARMTDYKTICEVTRLCTNGTKNACSRLYGAAARVAKELGYEKIQTFILETETGVSLTASGWEKTNVTGGGSWSRKNRNRTDKSPICKKIKFEKKLNLESSKGT